MRLEPEERRNYVLSQLDDYGRCYMTCLETFVYRLWSRQRILLKNCKLYEEKLMTISEVIGTLTGRDSVLENNNLESAKLEKSLREIHSIVFIPPIKSNDISLISKILVKEEEDLNFMSLALSPSGSQLMSPLGLASMECSSSGGRHQSVIKSRSSSPSPSSHVERLERESNSNVRESATSFVRVNGSKGSRQGSAVITSSHNSPPNTHSTNPNNHNNSSRRPQADLKVSTTSNNINSNGHAPVISSTMSNRPVGRPSRANECLNSAAAIAAVTAAINNQLHETSSSTSSNQSTNQSNNSNDRESDGNEMNIVVKKESDAAYASRRNGSSKRSNGTAGGSAPKKSRNNRTKDDKEIVKCCAQKGCEYIERDNANNMRKHYRNWHDDIDYPPAPYIKKEMTTETVNQFLHNWMVQRKKKQPRGPRNESRIPDGWPAMTIDGMLVYADESDTGHEDEDYEINEHLVPFQKSPKPIEMVAKRGS